MKNLSKAKRERLILVGICTTAVVCTLYFLLIKTQRATSVAARTRPAEVSRL